MQSCYVTSQKINRLKSESRMNCIIQVRSELPHDFCRDAQDETAVYLEYNGLWTSNTANATSLCLPCPGQCYMDILTILLVRIIV